MMKLSYRNERNARFISEFYNKPLEKPDWYKIENVTDDEAEILIYDYIGWPFNDAADFVQTIRGITSQKITIRINSPGGDVFDGIAIANAIAAHPSKPITRIESLAASAASYIAVSGHEKQAYKNTMIMIHEPMTGMWGNQHDLRDVADILKQINDQMVDIYADHTDVGKRELKSMLKEETWMTAAAAKGKGFVDTILQAGSPTEAKFDLSMFAKTPEQFQSESEKPTKRTIERALRDAGMSRSQAKALLAGSQRDDGDSEERLKSLEAQIAAQATLLKFKGN
jgi:ATP-dependent protease ClpP protease subunit